MAASESSFPFTTSTLATEEQWLRYQRAAGTPDGVLSSTYNPGDTTCKVTAAAGTTVTIAPGEAMVGGFYYRNTTSFTLPVPTNAGNPAARQDYVVLRASQSSDNVTATYLTGGSVLPTPAADVAGNWDLILASVTVPAGSATVPSANVTDLRVFVSPGPRMSVSTGVKPTARVGSLLTAGNVLHVADGTGWKQVYPQPNPVWHSPTFFSGVRNYGSTWEDVHYALGNDNIVRMRGLGQLTSNKATGASLVQIPYTPRQRLLFLCITSQGPWRLDVDSSGRVLNSDDAGRALLDGSFISFNGIYFDPNG